MSVETYMQARKDGMREVHALRMSGEDPFLPVLGELVPKYNQLSQVSLGLIQISVSQIAGTATKGRTSAFSRSFLPLLDVDSEFAMKWSVLYDAVVEEGLREPVKALEYYNRFYIIEGNKRVSVMRRLDAVTIEANVTRILPEAEDSERYRIYQEFLGFYADTGINFIYFSREGSFARLYALMSKHPGEKWHGDDVFDLQSCYYRFSQAYYAHAGAQKLMSASDAFLIYLEVFGYEDSVNKTPSEFMPGIRRIWPEFVVAAANKPAAVLSKPMEKQQSLLQSVLNRSQPLRCAFLYNRSPQTSGWTYWHELGRNALEEMFASKVETTYRDHIEQQDAEAAIESLVAEGYQVIFATSPIFLEACMRQSVAHPQVKILNCSLLASYHNVRSYYLRIYEAKFILGAIAGACADNNRIGYIADYPIYGVPASINAFALGAQMTNPRAEIYLEWSTIPGHDPERALAGRGVRIVSNRDISAPRLESRAFGLYDELDGQISSLASPVWNWAKLYQGIVRSILTGAWADEGQHNADRAMSYYMGMSFEAIDIVCSRRLPVRVKRLVDLLQERISSGALQPFIGPIVDQAGSLRVPDGVALTPQEIIRMDYLAENVVGSFPRINELNTPAQQLAGLQGLKAVSAAADEESADGGRKA